jgi:hypothetical protein
LTDYLSNIMDEVVVKSCAHQYGLRKACSVAEVGSIGEEKLNTITCCDAMESLDTLSAGGKDEASGCHTSFHHS